MKAEAAAIHHPFTEWPKDEINQSIAARFERQAVQYPHHVAVKSANSCFSYRELNRNANRLAHAILTQRGAGEETVALLLQKGVSLMAAIMGVLKAGKICVPIEPSLPEARIAAILADCDAPLILTDAANSPVTHRLAGEARTVIRVDAASEQTASLLSCENPDLVVSPDAPAYIIYTSGSTGQPKGVIQSHHNVLRQVRSYTNTLHISSTDRVAMLGSGSVGQGVKTIFNALLNGAALYPFDIKSEGVAALGAWLRQEEITIYISTATVFRHFVGTLSGQEEFPQLRLIRLGGEPVRKRDVELFQGHFAPHCTFVNTLSSTETGNLCMYLMGRDTPLDGDVVPVGHPVEDVDISLLDETGEAVRVGCVGEIVVRSRYLSPGYWRNPALTQAAFLPMPGADSQQERLYRTGDLGLRRADGCLEHRGRKDFQVKIRGYRIEPEEIEAVLQQHSGVRECVVVAREGSDEEKQLVAYFVPTGEEVPARNELHRFVKELLPDYMVPAAFVPLAAFPLTVSGKVDRRALPAPHEAPPIAEPVDASKSGPASRSDFLSYRNPSECQLVHIWEDILGARPIGVRDDFFELGGHSLLAAQMMEQVAGAFGKKLPLSLLFENATIEYLAQALYRESDADLKAPLVMLNAEGTRRPFFFAHGDLAGGGLYSLNIARHVGPEQPFYLLPTYGSLGREDEAIPPTIEAMATAHLQTLRAVQPQGPYLLGGACNGGLIVFEMARQLQQSGEQVDLLVLIQATVTTLRFRTLQRALKYGGFVFGRSHDQQLVWYLRLRSLTARIHRFRTMPQPERVAVISRTVRRRAHRTQAEKHPKKAPVHISSHYRKATASYVPGRYRGRLTLLWAAEVPTWRKTPTMGWEQLSDKVIIHTIPGDHDTITTKYAPALAERLKICLDAVQGHQTTSQPGDNNSLR